MTRWRVLLAVGVLIGISAACSSDGSSGAGTSTVKSTFDTIFRREGVKAAVIEGDAFHRFSRKEMKGEMAQAERENRNFSHFSQIGRAHV